MCRKPRNRVRSPARCPAPSASLDVAWPGADDSRDRIDAGGFDFDGRRCRVAGAGGDPASRRARDLSHCARTRGHLVSGELLDSLTAALEQRRTAATDGPQPLLVDHGDFQRSTHGQPERGCPVHARAGECGGVAALTALSKGLRDRVRRNGAGAVRCHTPDWPSALRPGDRLRSGTAVGICTP